MHAKKGADPRFHPQEAGRPAIKDRKLADQEELVVTGRTSPFPGGEGGRWRPRRSAKRARRRRRRIQRCPTLLAFEHEPVGEWDFVDPHEHMLLSLVTIHSANALFSWLSARHDGDAARTLWYTRLENVPVASSNSATLPNQKYFQRWWCPGTCTCWISSCCARRKMQIAASMQSIRHHTVSYRSFQPRNQGPDWWLEQTMANIHFATFDPSLAAPLIFFLDSRNDRFPACSYVWHRIQAPNRPCGASF